jgi:two-component system, NarL family, sensor kinase
MARIGKLLRSPVVQFLATGLLTLAVLLVGTAVLNSGAAREKALQDAQTYTKLLAGSVAEPSIPRGLVEGNQGAADRFNLFAEEFLTVGGMRRIKIWNEDGTIIYSDEEKLIGKTFKLGHEELEILHSRNGGTDAEPTDLTSPENEYEPDVEMVEVYTQIQAPDDLGNSGEGPPLLFEAYFSVAEIERQQAAMIAPFRSITLGALGILVAVATALLWVLTRRITRAAAERERLLRSAASASDAERRRIARDLHDGVVQDLAGSTFALSALSRDATGAEREALLETEDSLRSSLRALRSLLVEIHPPGLSAESLPAALQDLIAPAEATGVRATVDVSGGRGATGETVALVWRVAQEAVRNTLRHARAAALSVVVREKGGNVVLEVTDDGVGFDPGAVRPDVHYGLRGLDSLVRDSGGTLVVRSAPGAGTTIRLETGR